ncbi:MAG: hypothetical protein OEZ22_11485 [Spirochaetia bacterium]|nr:hypothetical protein [Spirochaetia bacterium]
MKTILTVLVVLLMINCKSTETERIKEGAANCNAICKSNPEINEYSQKSGGGMPLLFMGGFEIKCGCAERGK